MRSTKKYHFQPKYCVKRTILSSILSKVGSYAYNIGNVLSDTIHYNNMILVIFYNPTCTRSVLFGPLRMGKDTWLSQMPLYEVEKTLTLKYVSSYLKTRRDLHLLSLVDNFINYIYNCRFIRISSLLFERIIREANDIFVVQNTMIIIL